jgi:LmbE family N-acetylglucosaminyl deacetylase
MKKLFLLAVCILWLISGFSQTTSGEIYLGLKKLKVLGSVLYVAAHPDDENTRLITYFSKDKLYRTGYLSLTRGDGGQNLIGDEQGVELGLIRTQELLSARKIDGGEQFFTRAFDFGYSKTPAETFEKWDREKVLSDVVWVIRKFQPDVIITRFPATGEGTHGHHTASAILANEAFTAAADPNRFPEQLKWVKPWQAKRILWNNFFGNSQAPADAFKIDVGGYNSVLGKSYGEIAGESRSQHKSQGFGAGRGRGEAFEYFRTTGGSAPRSDLFDDVNLNWSRVDGGEAVDGQIDEIIASYDFMKPQQSVPQLVQLYQTLNSMVPGYWRNKKLSEVKDLIEAAGGIWIEAFTTTAHAVQGDSVTLNLVLNNRLGVKARLQNISGDEGFFPQSNFSMDPDSVLPYNRNFITAKTVLVSNAISQPYWLEEKMNQGYYNVSRQEMIGVPDVEPGFMVNFQVNIEGQDLVFTKPVLYKHTDPVRGELYQPVTIIPGANASTSPEVVLFKKGESSTEPVSVQVNANKNIRGAAEGHIRSAAFDQTKKDPGFALNRGEVKTFNFMLDSKEIQPKQKDFLYGSVLYGEQDDNSAFLAMRTIRYDHIPTITYFYADAVTIVNIDLKTYGKKIGYIVGAGDRVPEALEQMGYEVTILTDKELARNDLARFDAIITGVRAYNTNEWLNSYYPRLMKYVENGGNLIVQYNTSNNIGPVRARIGPYHFNITRNRITDENAVVKFNLPDHPALNFPNKITQNDFKDWVQERSIYHAGNYDTAFKAIFSMSDPGEKADDGSLIIAKYGKGYFTYTGLVFFRELPAAVPGAYRLLANLIALNRKKEF